MIRGHSVPHSQEYGKLWLRYVSGVRDSTFLHSLPPFCDAEEVENHAPGSLVHLAEINSNTRSNYQNVVIALLEKSAIDSLFSAYAVMWVRRLNS